MAGKTRTARSGAGDGRAYLAKAHEFLAAAEDASGRGHHSAVVGNAVHATIAAADAVASVRLGSRWKDDHSGAAEHVAAAGPEGEVCARSLRVVLAMKHQAEYDPVPSSAAKALRALRAAGNAVTAAQIVVAQQQNFIRIPQWPVRAWKAALGGWWRGCRACQSAKPERHKLLRKVSGALLCWTYLRRDGSERASPAFRGQGSRWLSWWLAWW